MRGSMEGTRPPLTSVFGGPAGNARHRWAGSNGCGLDARSKRCRVMASSTQFVIARLGARRPRVRLRPISRLEGSQRGMLSHPAGEQRCYVLSHACFENMRTVSRDTTACSRVNVRDMCFASVHVTSPFYCLLDSSWGKPLVYLAELARGPLPRE